MPGAGGLGLFAQSGALGIAVLASADRRGLGVSDFASAGNRVDVSGNDLMQYWIDDDNTAAVGLYLESIGNPRKFSRIARGLAQRKPVIAVSSGVSAYGAPPGHRVRQTHVPSGAFGAMLRQAGVIRVENVHQLFDVAQLVIHQPLPGRTARRRRRQLGRAGRPHRAGGAQLGPRDLARPGLAAVGRDRRPVRGGPAGGVRGPGRRQRPDLFHPPARDRRRRRWWPPSATPPAPATRPAWRRSSGCPASTRRSRSRPLETPTGASSPRTPCPRTPSGRWPQRRATASGGPRIVATRSTRSTSTGRPRSSWSSRCSPTRPTAAR